MLFYYIFACIAALFGHRKARQWVQGQREMRRLLHEPSSILSSADDANTAQPAAKCIWFHAASVGEFEQARPIIERLKAEHPTWRVILTFFSPSGYELRKNYDKVTGVFYLPLPTRRTARRWLDKIMPDMAVFVKYEFWPAYLKELSKRQIPTYSISAIFRPKQLFFRPWGKAYLRLLNCFTAIFVQDEASADLLLKYGIDHVKVTGDTRFDRVCAVAEEKKELMPMRLFAEDAERVLVAGSTWPPDERLLQRYMDERPDTKLILAPHEISEKHLEQTFQLFEGRFVRLSEANRNNVRAARILLVDSIGQLSTAYRYGQVAYIGGGFGVGIHNTIEAAAYGIPVLFGPNYKHFREAKALIEADAAITVRNYKQLEAGLDRAIDEHRQMGEKAMQYVNSERGATDRIYQELFC